MTGWFDDSCGSYQLYRKCEPTLQNKWNLAITCPSPNPPELSTGQENKCPWEEFSGKLNSKLFLLLHAVLPPIHIPIQKESFLGTSAGPLEMDALTAGHRNTGIAPVTLHHFCSLENPPLVQLKCVLLGISSSAPRFCLVLFQGLCTPNSCFM